MLETCISVCKICRECARHSISQRTSAKMRNQSQKKYKPELLKDCPGYIEVYVEDGDTDTDT
jgi:hypothetical protein